MDRAVLAALALVAVLAPLGVHSSSSTSPGAPAVHPAAPPRYLPHAGDSFSFRESTTVQDGVGNYSGYTEVDATVGTLNVTAVALNGTETATYNYSGEYSNSEGTAYPWSDSGTFTFSATTFAYVHGTDDEPGFNGSGEWFYLNNSLPAGSQFSQLDTPMTVESVNTSYPLDTGAGTTVRTIYTDGIGSYQRDDDYGDFLALYDMRAYFDPTTGYIVGYNYTEVDSDGHGDGFVLVDDLQVVKATFALTPQAPPTYYSVEFAETGLGGGAGWTVVLDGTGYAGSGSTIVAVHAEENGTYLFTVSAGGYSASPSVGFVNVSNAEAVESVAFSASASSPGYSLYEIVAVVLVLVVIVALIAWALARRSRAGASLPRHSATGRPQYGGMPTGAPPPPISLRPGDQPQIQQVVVKEVVKVNCRYCGSLIDSTAEKCPFCGATRS